VLIRAEGKNYPGKIIRGDSITAAPHLFASGVHFQLTAYAVSCAASTMYTSETKARRMIKFLFVTGILSVVPFSSAPLSTTHMLITDLFELLGKEQTVVRTMCKAVPVTTSRLLAHPACSLDARQARNRDGTNEGLRGVAVEWSLFSSCQKMME
jgi:hypothetical protein